MDFALYYSISQTITPQGFQPLACLLRLRVRLSAIMAMNSELLLNEFDHKTVFQQEITAVLQTLLQDL